MKLNQTTFKLKSLLLLLLALPGLAFAQQVSYTISGAVTDADGLPLIGASVFIPSLYKGTVTDADGAYRLQGEAAPGNYQLEISYFGYRSQQLPVEILSSTTSVSVNVSMAEDILALDEVVVTGAAINVNKKKLGNAISTLKGDDLQNGGAISIDQALSGKVAGALIQQNSGDPAAGISVRLRGPSTISGSSEPLYIIDGILVNNSSNQLVDLGGNSQNRLADLNPNDIDRIEIIKGAAAAAIYGSRASNGVVQIFTKRGKAGVTKYNFSTSLISNSLRKKIDYNDAPLAWEDPFDRTNLATRPVTRYDYQDQFFTTGLGIENFLSASGGSDKTRFFLSGSYLNNEGIIKNTGFQRYGLKANLDHQATSWLSVNAGLNYVRSSSMDVPNGGLVEAYGAITGFLFSDNSVNPEPDDSGVYPVTSLLVPRTNPLEAVERFNFGQVTNRVITSLGANAKLAKGLTASYIFGLDTYNQSATGFIPPGNTSTQPDGFARRSDVNVLQFNNDLSFAYDVNLSSRLVSTTVLGGTWQYESRDLIAISATELPPVVQIAQSGAILAQGESRTQISYWGAFLQQSFGFDDKLFINGAVRQDGASVFGKDERNQLYFKASAAYLLSNEPFWQGGLADAISTFKIRTSWGQAGNLTALGFFDRLSIYGPVAIGGKNGLVPSANQGFEGLRPERQEEFEAGFDASFFKDRVGVEFTYYNQQVSDLLLQRELAPSTGFGTRFENVGGLQNTGIELLLRINAVQSRDFNWSITSTFTRNVNEVTNVAGELVTLPNSFSTNFVIEGQPLGVFYRQFYARDENGEIALDDDGYPFGGVNEDGTRSKVIGDPNPEWFGALINEFRYKQFGLRVQFDAVQGYDVLNWNRRLLDNVIFGGGYNVGQELLGNRPKGTGGAQANIFEEFVEDGSFVKLREISLSYTIKPASPAVDNITLSLIGRNLVSWDSYSGWDPEVNTPGQSNGVRGFDFGAVPIPRTFRFSINIGF